MCPVSRFLLWGLSVGRDAGTDRTGGSGAAASRLASWASRHTALVLFTAVVATGLLAVPMLTMPPEEFASQEPDGPVFDARDQLEDRFGAGVVEWLFIVEARDGEMLDRESLLALAHREQELRAESDLDLVKRTDPVFGQQLDGIVSLASTLDRVLADQGGLEGASEEAVHNAVDQLLDDVGPGELGVSTQASQEPSTGRWRAPAVTVSVLVDGASIDERGTDAGFGTDVAVEEAGRQVQGVLRGSDALDVWGVAIDQALTGEEQGQAAGPFIGITVLVILLLVGLAFRNYWTLAVVGAALTALLVWLQGLANLLGLKEDQILSTVVPIAMLAFGVDYAFHAVGRYREEQATGQPPAAALRRGLGGVLPALVLALATGALAFLANTASAIESITQFGIAATIALAAAFLMLGVVVPVAVAAIDRRLGPRPGGTRRWLGVAGGLGAAATAMTAVLLVVFLAPEIGLALLAVYLLVFLALPLLVAGRVPARDMPEVRDVPTGDGPVASWLGRLVVGIAARRRVVLPTVAAVSIVAAVYAVQVPAAFDVEDFFAPDTDFVVGLDKVDEHIGTQGGEQAQILVTGNLENPDVRTTLTDFVARVGDLDTDLLAQGPDGRVSMEAEALDVLAGTSPLDAREAAEVVAPGDDDPTAARLGVGLVGSRAQENVAAARALLEPLVGELNAELQAQDPDAQATLTGTPIVRQASLEAVSHSLQVSLPIAVLLCLLVVAGFLRSWRYALVSLVPILLVVAWLYGFMYLAGYSVNLVTATIGAISIGIGIDFSTHMTMRYREELLRQPNAPNALHTAARGTGVALLGSTVSSAAGFAILAFAPMPMFASFGLLTAVMICLALLATLLVLPSLLLLVSRHDAAPQPPNGPTGPHAPTGKPPASPVTANPAPFVPTAPSPPLTPTDPPQHKLDEPRRRSPK